MESLYRRIGRSLYRRIVKSSNRAPLQPPVLRFDGSTTKNGSTIKQFDSPTIRQSNNSFDRRTDVLSQPPIPQSNSSTVRQKYDRLNRYIVEPGSLAAARPTIRQFDSPPIRQQYDSTIKQFDNRTIRQLNHQKDRFQDNAAK